MKRVLVLLIVVAWGCGSDREPSLEEIQRMLQAGETNQAIEQMRTSLGSNPAQPELQLLYGRVLAELGHTSLAVWPLRKAAESSSHAEAANLALAGVLLRIGNAEDAIKTASRVIEQDPEHVGALGLRAHGYLATRQEEEALGDIERILAVAPDDIDAHLSKTLALLGLERAEEAGQALRAVKEMAAEQPSDFDDEVLAPRLCLAEAMFVGESGNEKEGERLFADCLERFPTSPLAVSEGARLYAESGRRDLAIGVLRRAVDQAPENLAFRAELARLLRADGSAEEAERVLIEATKGVEDPSTWIVLFDHYSAVEDHEAARTAIERVREYGPLSVRLRIAYADTLVIVGEYVRAEAEADMLPEGFAQLIRGRILLEKGDARNALAHLEQGVQHWPDNATARWLAAQAAERSGQFARAISHYRESVRSDVGATHAALHLARLHAAVGQPADAFDAAVRYVQSHPEELQGYGLAATLAVRLDHPESARETLARMETLPGGPVEAVRLRAEFRTALGAEPSAAAELIEASDLELTDPANAAALDALLHYLAAAGASDRALERVDRAIAAHPNYSGFHALRGRALSAAEHRVEAKAAFAHALQLDGEDFRALLGLARLTREVDRDVALALYDRASAANSESALAAYEASLLVLEDPKRGEDAERRLLELLEAHPLHADAAHTLARLLAERESALDRAESFARRAVRLGAGLVALQTLGEIQLARGQAELAAETFRRVLEEQPDASGARYRLGLALTEMGDVEGAREALRLALAAGGFEKEAQALAALARLESAEGSSQ